MVTTDVDPPVREKGYGLPGPKTALIQDDPPPVGRMRAARTGE
ncbi:hypothetical protein [Streptosporangium sp. NPDC048865]